MLPAGCGCAGATGYLAVGIPTAFAGAAPGGFATGFAPGFTFEVPVAFVDPGPPAEFVAPAEGNPGAFVGGGRLDCPGGAGGATDEIPGGFGGGVVDNPGGPGVVGAPCTCARASIAAIRISNKTSAPT